MSCIGGGSGAIGGFDEGAFNSRVTTKKPEIDKDLLKEEEFKGAHTSTNFSVPGGDGTSAWNKCP